MPLSNAAADRPPKRMRLGTKSCAECRRRKVRCIYLPSNPICKECILHGAVCVPQTAQQSDHLTDGSLGDDKTMRQRLEELEGMVRHLSKALDSNADPTNPGQLVNSSEALRCLQQSSTPEQKSDSSSFRTYSIDNSELETPNDAADSTESFEGAPLLNLFQAAMLIEENEVHADTNRTGLATQHRIQACIKSLNSLMPSIEDLTLILQVTEIYWPLWHAFPEEILAPAGNQRSDGVARVRNFILESMKSSSAVVVAKAILCLAFCIQQLPAHFKGQRPNFPVATSALLDSYLVGAETLLPVNEGSASTIDGLECVMLQTLLYVDMGKPRNAWLCLRRAMSYAILQGLHTLDASEDERRVGVWNSIWQHDRTLSLLLGLPHGVGDTHPGTSKPHSGRPLSEQAMYEFANIAGHISNRNQNHRKVDYSITEGIEQELTQLSEGVGSSLLNTTPHSSMPLQAIYELQGAKIFYYNLCEHTHFPYMLKSTQDKKYEHNRLAALAAARGIIEAWQQLRDCSGDAIIICELMNFHVFTAAIVLILNLLSPSCLDPIHQQANDWEVIHNTTRNLAYVSVEMTCNVACQAATLLEYLTAAHQGIYDGPQIYEAVIPYFGQVRISQMRRNAPSLEASKDSGGWEEQEFWENTVEFNANEFVPFSQNYMGDYLNEAELGADWTAVLNADIGYDWSQSFHSSGSGMT